MVTNEEILLDGLVREIIDGSMDDESHRVSEWKETYPELDEKTIKKAIECIDEYVKDGSSDIVALILDS